MTDGHSLLPFAEGAVGFLAVHFFFRKEVWVFPRRSFVRLSFTSEV